MIRAGGSASGCAKLAPEQAQHARGHTCTAVCCHSTLRHAHQIVLKHSTSTHMGSCSFHNAGLSRPVPTTCTQLFLSQVRICVTTTRTHCSCTRLRPHHLSHNLSSFEHVLGSTVKLHQYPPLQHASTCASTHMRERRRLPIARPQCVRDGRQVQGANWVRHRTCGDILASNLRVGYRQQTACDTHGVRTSYGRLLSHRACEPSTGVC
jgi:hypothetical protein